MDVASKATASLARAACIAASRLEGATRYSSRLKRPTRRLSFAPVVAAQSFEADAVDEGRTVKRSSAFDSSNSSPSRYKITARLSPGTPIP